MSVRMRHTSSHTRNRRSHHALLTTNLVADKESGNLRLPHRLDEATGMYRGIQIVSKKEMKKNEDKAEAKSRRKQEHVHAEGALEPVHAEKHTAKDAAEIQSQGVQPSHKKDRARSLSGTS